MDPTSVLYNNQDLSKVVGVMVYDHDFNALPKKDVKEFKLSRKSKSIITSAEYVDKQATVSMLIKKCSRQDSEIALKNLKALMQVNNQLLTVLQAGEVINYTATLNTMSYSWFGNNLDITLGFICSDPLGENSIQTNLANVEITTSNRLIPILIDGSAKAQLFFSLNITAVTGGTAQTLSVMNSVVSQGIQITRNWANGDTVEIDCENESVTINGLYQDFDGIFPIFDVGNQSLQYVDTFTTRDVNLVAKYNKRYS